MPTPQDFGSFFFWATCGLLTLLVTIFGYFAGEMREDFRRVSLSLNALATNLALLTARLESFEKTLDHYDGRLEKLEKLRDD